MILIEAPIIEFPDGSVHRWESIHLPHGFCLHHAGTSFVVSCVCGDGRAKIIIIKNESSGKQTVIAKSSCRGGEQHRWVSEATNKAIMQHYRGTP